MFGTDSPSQPSGKRYSCSCSLTSIGESSGELSAGRGINIYSVATTQQPPDSTIAVK